MKKFNFFLFALLVIFSLSRCSFNDRKRGELSIKVKVLNRASQQPFYDTLAYEYLIRVELFNSTDSIISFWAMNCSWESNWITENRNSRLLMQECDKNFPEVYIIKPDSCIIYEGVLVTPDTLKKINKLGFILIRETDIENEREFVGKIKEKATERKDIFWSNEFTLN